MEDEYQNDQYIDGPGKNNSISKHSNAIINSRINHDNDQYDDTLVALRETDVYDQYDDAKTGLPRESEMYEEPPPPPDYRESQVREGGGGGNRRSYSESIASMEKVGSENGLGLDEGEWICFHISRSIVK